MTLPVPVLCDFSGTGSLFDQYGNPYTDVLYVNTQLFAAGTGDTGCVGVGLVFASAPDRDAYVAAVSAPAASAATVGVANPFDIPLPQAAQIMTASVGLLVVCFCIKVIRRALD